MTSSSSKTPVLTHLPGLLAAAAVLACASVIADALGRLLLRAQGLDPEGRGSPVSAISIAIILGILIAQILPAPTVLKPGLTLAIRKVLRIGIVLVGLKLSIMEVLRVGAIAIPVVIALITIAFATTIWLAKRLGVGARFGLVAAAATSICGVTAAVATAPVVEAEDREVAYTIAIVTLFGLFGMLVYPFVAHALFADNPLAAGLFLGTSIHDTSQVMGGALAYREMFGDAAAFEAATVTKLTRNLFIAVVVPLAGLLWARSRRSEERRTPIASLLPVFVIFFVLMAIVRSAGDATLERTGAAYGLFSAADWRTLISMLGDRASYYALGLAMAAVGLTTDIRSLRALGLRPLWVGAGAAFVVAGTGLALATIAG